MKFNPEISESCIYFIQFNPDFPDAQSGKIGLKI